MVIVNLDKRIVRVVFILTYSLLLFSVLTKLFCIPYISEKFHTLGISEYCRIFGSIELLAIIAFIYPRTIGIGLMMLCIYFGGAIATDIHSPSYLYQPLVVLAFIFATAIIRKPSLFHENIIIQWNEHR
jgi:hypothetical protein